MVSNHVYEISCGLQISNLNDIVLDIDAICELEEK